MTTVFSRLDQIEFHAELIMAEMEAIEEKADALLTFNEKLNAAYNPLTAAAIDHLQDKLEAVFSWLVSEFDALEAQLDELGAEYDALLFVVSLAVPA